MSLVVTPSKATGEKIPVVFDFASKLAVGETLSTLPAPTVAISVWSGVDASPTSVLSGSATVSGTKVSQVVTGGVAGCIYKITCTPVTSSSNNPVIQTLLAVTQDPI